MSTCDNCRHQTPNHNCNVALERGDGIVWCAGIKAKTCPDKLLRAGAEPVAASDKQCSLCGGTGHRAHACRLGKQGWRS